MKSGLYDQKWWHRFLLKGSVAVQARDDGGSLDYRGGHGDEEN